MNERRDRRIVMGVITAAHGVRGEVKIKSFTENPKDIAAYGPLYLDESERTLTITRLRPVKKLLIARIEGITDRDAAEALKGRRLTLPRERLPEPEDEDEFYHEDLVGLAVFDPAGERVGTVVAVQNFGAGDLLEIRPANGGPTFYQPFTRRDVPEVDIAAGHVVIIPPGEENDGSEEGPDE